MDALPVATRRTRRPPRVPELPFVGSLVQLARDPLTFLTRIAATYGDAVRFHVPGQKIYLFNHPDAIEQVLVAERDNLIKDKLTRELSLMLGQGLLVSEGSFWRKQRRLTQPAFLRERIAGYGNVMASYAERAVSTWRDGERRDIHVDMMHLTLDIVAKTLFDVEIGDVARRIGVAMEALMDRYAHGGTLVPLAIPTPSNIRAKRAIAELDAIVYRIIRERRAAGGDSGDFVSMMLNAVEDGSGMDDVALRDEAMTLMLAGHETTAITLGFALDLLARHPAVADTLVKEVDAVLGDRPATAEDLPKLPFTDAVIRETMRLFPPAWALGRETTAPCTIGGFPLERGTTIWVAQWLVHRDARWFRDPLEYRPARWANGFAKTLPRQAYFPFGGGPRICIGASFATMEAVLVLATIVRRFRFTRTDSRPLALTPSITLRPKNGIHLVVHRRDVG